MKRIFYLSIYLFIIISINVSYAQEYNVFKEEMVEVSFISSVTKVTKEKFYLGLEFKLEPGWKIYWRQPGDSGMPPTLDYKDSVNLKSLELKWPFPTKEYEAANILTNIYDGEVIIPLEVAVNDHENPLNLKSILNFQVCKDICIPFETNLFIIIDSGKSNFTNYFYKIERALSKVPVDYKTVGINNIIINKDSENSLLFTLESLVDIPEGKLEIFIENKDEYIKINDINITKNLNNKISAKLILDRDINHLNELDIIFVKGNLPVNIKGIRIENNISKSIYLILLIALMGGLILNFMPCVLPVLILKLNRILSTEDKNIFNIRFNFLLTAFGIISSFILIAFITLFIKEISGQVGWGIQFQQPIFLFFLIFILIIFSLNLFDKIEFNLPNNISNNINKYLGKKSNGVAFFEGALATLLATPCSAPFLGTAVSFALSSNFYTTLLIFVFLGIGMSFPYLFLIIFPSLVMYLPKPGRWMVYLRYFLGLGLILTAVWLSYICISIIGFAIYSYFISVLIIFLLIISKLYIRKVSIILIIFLLLSNIYILYNAKYLEKGFSHNIERSWLKFSNEQLLNLINQGNTVFIDITAEWCITCKVNKILVLNSKEFKNLIKDNNIILMRGDWTKPNKKINNFLHNTGRYGIPFNAIYNPDYPDGLLFSEILSIKEIEDNLIKMQTSNAK
jgi:suppressor for copper-sensitivity B